MVTRFALDDHPSGTITCEARLEFTEDEYALCRKQAGKVASKWKAAQREDIEADLYLWLCENYRHVERYRTEDGGKQKLAKALYRHALGKAMREQEAHNGRRLQDEWSPYTKEQIKAALPFLWDRSEWPVEQASVDPRHEGVLSRGEPRVHDALAVLCDVGAAVNSLPKKYQRLLFLRYRMSLTTREIAEHDQLSTGEVSRRLWDAVEKVHARLSEYAYRSH